MVPKMIRTNIGKYYPKYAKLSDVGSHLGAICLNLSWGIALFILRPIFRTLSVVPPWTDFGC